MTIQGLDFNGNERDQRFIKRTVETLSLLPDHSPPFTDNDITVSLISSFSLFSYSSSYSLLIVLSHVHLFFFLLYKFVLCVCVWNRHILKIWSKLINIIVEGGSKNTLPVYRFSVWQLEILLKSVRIPHLNRTQARKAELRIRGGTFTLLLKKVNK
jgi:hypothetical protein